MVAGSADHRMATGRHLCSLLLVVEPIWCMYRGLYAIDRTTGARTQTAAHLRRQPRPRKSNVLMAAS